MRLKSGDSVFVGSRSWVGSYLERDGSRVKVHLPDGRAWFPREEVMLVAEALAEAVRGRTKYRNDFSYRGDSNLAELAAVFGYVADSRLRRDTLAKIESQLRRAGLQLDYDEPARDSRFWLTAQQVEETVARPLSTVGVPETAWPSALGLPDAQLMPFLRALIEPAPILCVLRGSRRLRHKRNFTTLWQGLLSWAYLDAQRFVRVRDDGAPSVERFSAAAAHAFLQSSGSVLAENSGSLTADQRTLYLVEFESGEEEVELERLRALWPGRAFVFDPAVTVGQSGQEDARVIAKYLALAGGRPDAFEANDGTAASSSRLHDASWDQVINWARDNAARILARGTLVLWDVLQTSGDTYRGSNESSTALALKALVGAWLQAEGCDDFTFEARPDEDDDEDDDEPKRRGRCDIRSPSRGVFEIETMLQSGPHELFAQRKVFARLGSAPFHLVVPSTSVLWAGPFLADIADRLGERGEVLLPIAADVEGESTDSEEQRIVFAKLKPRRLSTNVIDLSKPTISRAPEEPDDKKPLKLADLAGYQELRRQVEEEVLWLRRRPVLREAVSRTGGVLLFGPPGCGKSRLARCLAGELDAQVRLLAPSDLSGAFIGWGQILIREQFDWLAEDESRLLVIDEFDAIARSRRDLDQHTDSKANVNELLVHLDKASELGRLVVVTTNYVSSLDDAVLRSGRFGTFLPVAPPNAAEARDILDYYLTELGRDRRGEPLANLHVERPSRDALLELVEPALDLSGAEERGCMTGADLEAAVTRAFRTAVSRVLSSHDDTERHAALNVSVTAADLEDALGKARRSVTPDAFRGFLRELDTYGSEATADGIRKRFQ